ncbi:hypothetical protein BJ912DRAFT_921510 [Pholiota molesta]|nr:hypothetical protein BJ912DRAFT_921510 [Pholiota molesta]
MVTGRLPFQLPPASKDNMRILTLQFFAFLFTFLTTVNGFSEPTSMVHFSDVFSSSLFLDFWEEARKLGDKAVQYANEQIESIADHNTSITDDIHNYKASWTQVVKTIGELRPGMNADSQLIEIRHLEDEDYAFFFNKIWKRFLNEPLPENQSERYKQREVVINLALNMTEDVLVEAYDILDMPEEEVREKFGHVKPHIRQAILVMGNLADNHPEIVDIILFGAAILFGISPIGPVKGSPAAWAQRYFFGGTIPAKSWFLSFNKRG